jgi:hypothetical protein
MDRAFTAKFIMIFNTSHSYFGMLDSSLSNSIQPWGSFVSLGVPGLALGIFYMLWKRFHWEFPMVPKPWVGPLAFFFMLCATAIIFCALILWAPSSLHQSDTPPLTPETAVPKVSAAEFATLWLTIMDKGDYASSYKNVGNAVKVKFDQANWIDASNLNRLPLGSVLDRKLQTLTTIATDPGDGPGPTMQIMYNTIFENGHRLEYVWTTLDTSGVWHISGYYLYPAPG